MLTPVYPPHQGGVEAQVQLLSEGLARRGHEVTVITEQMDGASGEERGGGVRVIRLDRSPVSLDPLRSYLFIRRHAPLISRMVREEAIDLVHVHHFDRSSPYVSILKRHIRIPIVASVHALWHMNPQYLKWRYSVKEPFRWALRILPGLRFDRQSLQASDYLLPVSRKLEGMCREIREDDRIVTLPNAIDPERFRPDVKPVSLECDGYRILCPARLSPEKGQVYLIEALKTIRESVNAHVFLMGRDHENGLARLTERIHALGLEDHVHFIPPRPLHEVPRYYRAADLIVLPSLSESFGLVILENMALGNVVVASDVGGIPELITDGENGLLVTPAEPRALAGAVVQALLDTPLRERVRRNAMKKAEAYGIEENIKKIEHIYRRVCASQQPVQ